VTIWSIYHLVEIARRQHLPRAEKLIHVTGRTLKEDGTFGPLGHKLPFLSTASLFNHSQAHQVYQEERRTLAMVGPQLSAKVADMLPSRWHSFSTVRNMNNLALETRLGIQPPPSPLLLLSDEELLVKAKELAKRVVQFCDHPLAKLVPPLAILILYNVTLILAEWALWDETYRLNDFFIEYGKLWPFVTNPRLKLQYALQLKQDYERNQTQPMPRFRVMKLSTRVFLEGMTLEEIVAMAEQYEEDLEVPDFSKSFWNSTDDNFDIRSFLVDLGLETSENAPLFDTALFDFQ